MRRYAGVAFVVGGWLGVPVRVPAADLVARAEPGRVVVAEAGGAPVARFVFADPAVGRPALRDLHGPGGVLVTRPCPPRPGIDADDHATMHPGVMLCFSDLSGADPWRHKTAVRVTSCSAGAGEGGAATILCTSEYLGTTTDRPDAAPVCRERSRITIADRVIAGHAVRVVTWDGELTADRAPVVFGDVEEMGLGIRLIRELSPRGGGRYLASHGGRDEQGVFGKPAAWVDAAGTIDGGRHGVLLAGGRDQLRPSRFHARDTGWLLANPFGSRAYGAPEAGGATLAPGAALLLRFMLILHGDIPDADVGVVAAAIMAAR